MYKKWIPIYGLKHYTPGKNAYLDTMLGCYHGSCMAAGVLIVLISLTILVLKTI